MRKRQKVQQGLLLFLIWITGTGLINASIVSGLETGETVTKMKKKLSLSAEQEPLGDILRYVNKECGVKVMGVEDREKELLTFQAQNEPVDKALKRLLRQLNETNYVFVYSRTRLKHVAIYPGSRTGSSYRPVPVPEGVSVKPFQAPESAKVVKVLKINDDTQAETLDIQVGDLVVEYDGARIQSAQELVQSVKKKSPDDTVEMVLVRNGDPVRVLLNGGLIGINIRTVSVPRDELSILTY
jgi:type II secretory pathway component GspD/PulD (secretin)